jgi:UDP-N-acetyl-D-glucosamine dehydrogenase
MRLELTTKSTYFSLILDNIAPMSNSRSRASIVGQGYVGLPLAMAAVKAGWDVTGIDVSAKTVESLNGGISHIEDVSNKELGDVVSKGVYRASIDGKSVEGSDVCVICVPTPLDSQGLPDLTFLKSAVTLVAEHLKPDVLLVSESTSYPGTVRDLVKPLVASLRSDGGEKMSFASAPERVDPRNAKWNMENTPRLVSGIDDVSTRRALDFYSSICETVIPVSKPEVAEMAKLLENTFRQVNIALVNQLVPFCKELGIDVREVVEAAGSKPYGYMKFYPGAGVGGHCIPIDPLYLLWKARQIGHELPFVAKADEINAGMPRYVVERLIEMTNPAFGSHIAILGVAYKSGISDIRESPAQHVAEALVSKGLKPVWFDPLVENFHGFEKLTNQSISGAIVVTAQKDLPVRTLSKIGVAIIDCTGAYKDFPGVVQL